MKPPLPIPAEAEGHTPVPFKAQTTAAVKPHQEGATLFAMTIYGSDGLLVGKGYGRTARECMANAALIAHCVTNYAAALERIKAVEGTLERILNAYDSGPAQHIPQAYLAEARALLAQQEPAK